MIIFVNGMNKIIAIIQISKLTKASGMQIIATIGSANISRFRALTLLMLNFFFTRLFLKA
jgi:hypothetical protein